MAEIIGEIVGRALVYGVAAVVVSAAAEDEVTTKERKKTKIKKILFKK